ncbi:DUF427 domain-containing protein [Streptomyces sp. ISL-10]|uniref:DUF427 domain-containing protein n=1 Tax=Streptomyces sp. ISL-10 TaxID=2819172 RepID=UPI0035AC155E
MLLEGRRPLLQPGGRGLTNPDAAWYYPKPSPFARKIKGHVAFWQGVRVEGTPETVRESGPSSL